MRPCLAVPASCHAQLPETTAWACLHSVRSLDALLAAYSNAGGVMFTEAGRRRLYRGDALDLSATCR
jgi:hypothetical protein